MSLDLEALATRLREHLSRETRSPVEVSGPRLLPGGASRAAVSLDIRVSDGPKAGFYPTVARVDLGGKIYASSLSRVEEGRVIEAAWKGGVPVPRPLWVCADPAILGRDFIILERVEGETVGRRIVQRPDLEDARRVLPTQMAAALARIHALDRAQLDFLPAPQASESPALAAVRRAREELDGVAGAHPALEAALVWLAGAAPACAQPVVAHGDFRLGNMVVGTEGLRAVLDWEFSCIGDRHEDLAWPFVRDWRFGRDELRFAGVSDGEDFLAAYEAASGRRVDRRALAYWEVLGNLRWAVGCHTQARRHLSGEEPSVELASLGRRAAEMELETLDGISRLAREGSR